MNVLKPHLEITVVTLLGNGVGQREICRKTGIDRKTVRRIQRRLAAKSPTPATGSEGTGEVENPPPWPPAQATAGATNPAAAAAQHARSACEAHRQWIEAQLRLSRNAVGIYQDLKDFHGFTAGYNSVKRFCRRLRAREPEQYDRLEFAPGEESQVDYGEGAPTRHPVTGKYRKPRLFVMTLKYSRRSFRKVVWKSSAEIWARLHEEAFRYFGGSVRYVVLDNLKEGVIKPDLYEPEINRVYGALLAHYSVAADPARVRDPDRKGTVENASQHTQSTALKGKRFESIEEQNLALMRWEEKWAAPRIRGRAKRQVEEMFQEERGHLQPLPLEAFRFFTEGTRTVGDDTTVQIGGSWYAAGPARIGSEVLVRIYPHEIEIRDVRTLQLLFPGLEYRRAYDSLLAEQPDQADLDYVRILHLAATDGEEVVRAVLADLLAGGAVPTYESVRAAVRRPRTPNGVPCMEIAAPDLAVYDRLLGMNAEAVVT